MRSAAAGRHDKDITSISCQAVKGDATASTPCRVVDLVSDVNPGRGSGDDDPSVFVLDEQRFSGGLSSTDEDLPGLKQVLRLQRIVALCHAASAGCKCGRCVCFAACVGIALP
jgi:hypothetical protein